MINPGAQNMINPNGVLKDKVLFVAGAGPLMGGATARIAAREGAKVALAARSPDTTEELVSAIRGAGGTAIAIQCDLSDDRQLKAAIKKAGDEFGTVNAVFYNAAYYDHCNDSLDLDLEEWNQTININLMGAMATARLALPGMLKGGGGSFVFNSSAAALNAEGFRLGYSVSKAGLDAVVRFIARKYGRQGIRANSIYPFVIPPGVPQQLTDGVNALTCLGRSGTADEIGETVTFLLSDRSSYITGESIHVDGGLFAGAHWPEIS